MTRDRYRILITGSRDWLDAASVELEILACAVAWCRKGDGRRLEDVTLVHGGCKTGADRHAQFLADRVGLRTEVFGADWSQGLKAGPMRNQRMVNTRPDIVIAFNLGTPGTTGCVQMAVDAGLHVVQHGMFGGRTCIEQESNPPEEP